MNKYLISVSGVAMALVLSSTALGAVTIFGSGTPILSGPMNTNFANLNGNLTDGTCVGAMTRVGPTCVDNVRQGPSVAWNTAVNTCRTAGKRLMTPGEYIAAKNQAGVALVMNTNGEFEWVDSVLAFGVDGGGQPAGRMAVGYMGPAANPLVPVDGDIFYAANANYDDATLGFIYFRCAR